MSVAPERNGKFYIEAPLQTETIFPLEILKRDFQTAFNKEVRSFHVPPEEDIDSFVGVVNKVWWDHFTNKPWVRLEIFGNSSWGREVQQILLEDAQKPLSQRRIRGISAGVLEWYRKGTKELAGIHIREVSLADDPACDVCTIRKISLNNKKIGGNSMPNDGEENPLIRNYQKLLEEKEAKIAEFQSTISTQWDQLTKLKEIVDEQSVKIENFSKMETEYKGLQAKLKTYNARLTIVQKYEKYSNDPSNPESKKLFDERMEELSKLPAEDLDIILKGYQRIVKLNEKGLDIAGNPTGAALQTPAIQNFEGINPNELPPEDFAKAVDDVIDRMPEAQSKSIGGF